MASISAFNRVRLLAVVGLLLCAGDFVAAQSPRNDAMAGVLSRGVLRVAMYHEDIYPLFSRDGQGHLVGHEVDLAQRMAVELGVKIRFNREARSFNGVIEQVRAGEADLGISLISQTLPRALKVQFSSPYMVVHPVVLLNRSSFPRSKKGEFRRALQNRSDFSIGVKKGTSYQTIAAHLYPGRRLKVYDDWDAVSNALVKGDVDVMVRDEIGVHNMLRSNAGYLLNIARFVESGYDDNIAVVLPYGDDRLLQWVNIFLDQSAYPISVDELFRRYEYGS